MVGGVVLKVGAGLEVRRGQVEGVLLAGRRSGHRYGRRAES